MTQEDTKLAPPAGTAVTAPVNAPPPLAKSPLRIEASMEVAKKQVEYLEAFYKGIMKKGTDYGVIEGTDKPTLLKSGAELLLIYFNYSAKFFIDDAGTDLAKGIFHYRVTTQILDKFGNLVDEGVGYCTSLESKYRYRWVAFNKLNPQEQEWAKARDPRLVVKFKGKFPLYRQENQNPSDVANTVLKMAKKRSLVDAILTATGASRIFTQDLEEMERDEEPDVDTDTGEILEPKQAAKPKQEPAKKTEMPEYKEEDALALMELRWPEDGSEIDQRMFEIAAATLAKYLEWEKPDLLKWLKNGGFTPIKAPDKGKILNMLVKKCKDNDRSVV